MQEAYRLAGRKINERGVKTKYYDRWVPSSTLQPGDRVLVRNLSERGGPGKLRSFWENDIHVVVQRKGPESPVYEVRPEIAGKKNRVLHRNLLLPCDLLPAEDQQANAGPPQRSRNKRRQRSTVPAVTNGYETSTDEEEMPDHVTNVAPGNIDRNPEIVRDNETGPEPGTVGPEAEIVPENAVDNNQLQDAFPTAVPEDNHEYAEQDGANRPIGPPEAPLLVEQPRPRRTRQPPDRLAKFFLGSL